MDGLEDLGMMIKCQINRLMNKTGMILNEIEENNRKLLEKELWTDLEIRCRDGEIVKCHRAVLGNRSDVPEAMFQEGGEEGTTPVATLKMEEMSEASVRALLRWAYWNDETEALVDSDVAVELLIVGYKYELWGLVEKMQEIIMERRGYDEEWFSVESAAKLYGWGGRKLFMDKAVQVFTFFKKEFPEKLEGSEKYEEYLKQKVLQAMKLG